MIVEEQVLKIAIHNKEDNTWYCSICGKTSTNKRDLKRHIESLHIENHPGYTCDYCGEVKKSENAMRLHKKCKHREIF